MKAITDTGVHVELLEDGTWMRLQPLPAETSADAGFRSVPWGSSQSVAMEREGEEPSHRSEDLLYWEEKRLADLTVDVIYIYIRGALVRAKYLVSSKFANNNRYLDEFYGLHGLLSKKYGEVDPDYLWLGSTDWEAEEFGLAVAAGELIVSAKWSDGDTQIYLGLSAENYLLELVIEYRSLSLESVEAEVKTASIIADL